MHVLCNIAYNSVTLHQVDHGVLQYFDYSTVWICHTGIASDIISATAHCLRLNPYVMAENTVARQRGPLLMANINAAIKTSGRDGCRATVVCVRTSYG
jgi:hypothetical protein